MPLFEPFIKKGKDAMKNHLQWITGALTTVGILASQGVAAQYYLGVEAGHEDLSFKPEYRFVSGAPDRTFDNQAEGLVASVVGGYRLTSTNDFSLDAEGRLSISNSDWTLSLTEPASFRYDLPVNLALSLLPAYRISKNFSVFAEAGLALGKIRERKSTESPDKSRYDEETWRPGFIAGFGISLAVGDGWSLRAGYRRTWYKNHDFYTYDANGTQVETVTSRVVQSTTTLGLIREF